MAETADIARITSEVDRTGHRDGRETDATSRPLLRNVLVAVDLAAITATWAAVVVQHLLTSTITRTTSVTGVAGLAALTAFALLAQQGLYRSRVCRIRSMEIAGLGRAAAGSCVIGLAATTLLEPTLGVESVVGGALLTFLLLLLVRSCYRSWLTNARRQGRFCRPLVIVGNGQEAVDLYRLLDDHPELGFAVTGVVGDAAAVPDELPWLGPLDEAVVAIRDVGANGAMIAGGSLGAEELNEVARELLAASVHVHLSAGLRGIDYRRLRPYPLAYEPLFYLEQLTLARWQVATKRVLDVMLAGLALVAVLPVLAAAALAIKLEDRGAVLFRQRRVGRDGKLFTLYKLRTMVPDAEERLQEVLGANQRSGPLFKLAGDPRVTRIGRVLRATSIDELPQLVNVLRGDMSLVGPRPALLREVEQFDENLQARTRVMPGITGLWQVEARDVPSFTAYRRLDSYYVENWSIGLDLAILLATVRVVMIRSVNYFRTFRRQRRVGERMCPLD